MPVLRLLSFDPLRALTLLGGALFFAAGATSLGILTSNPKIFTVLALIFWYLAISDQGRTPGLNFAGWYGAAPFEVAGGYLAASVAALVVATLVFRWQTRK